MDNITIGYINGLWSSLADKNEDHIRMTFNDLVKLNNKNIFDVSGEFVHGNLFGTIIEKIYGHYTIHQIIKIIIESPSKFNFTNEHIEYAKMILKMIEDFKKDNNIS